MEVAGGYVKQNGLCQGGPWDGRSKLLCCRRLPMKVEQTGVPKCLHIKFRRLGITQKKTYNKSNMFMVSKLLPI
jgi:hypothetical protein